MYQPDASTTVVISKLTDCLCATSRPGFFDGVGTVVTKLLIQALPDLAIFGEKDYQQLLVIKRLTRDLDIPVEIIGAPTIREQTGWLFLLEMCIFRKRTAKPHLKFFKS
ncbi:MAG: hypothetical protein CM15mP62_04910 [Rhodospirillaceae bacterium]|nr:MAG: hypothetical protein CM15mP62_04910 [Rhodospirillaceae bacterium]